MSARRRRACRSRRPRSDDVTARRPHRRDARDRAGRLSGLRVVAEPREPRAGEAEVDRAGGGGVGSLGQRVSRRRRTRPRVDAIRAVFALPACGRSPGRPALRRRGPRDLRVPPHRLTALGRAVALPRRHRRGAGQGSASARGVRVPLPRGHSVRRAFSRPPDRVPARLPRRLRVHGRSARPAGSSSHDWTSAVCSRSRRARARRC